MHGRFTATIAAWISIAAMMTILPNCDEVPGSAKSERMMGTQMQAIAIEQMPEVMTEMTSSFPRRGIWRCQTVAMGRMRMYRSMAMSCISVHHFRGVHDLLGAVLEVR